MLSVTRAVPAGPGVRRLTLRDPEGWPLPKIRPGAHIDLQVPDVGPRAYSLCGDPAEATSWEIAVKREANSRGGSIWAHDVLAVGDTVYAALPRCTFPLASDATRHVMVAGGIGVTPFLAMAHVLHHQAADWRLHLLHRGPPPCPEELAPWIGHARAVLHDTSLQGRPDWEALLGPPGPRVQAYCCGPQSMLDDFATATSHWPAGMAQVEYFVPPAPPVSPDARAYTVQLSNSGRRIEVGSGENLLTALRKAGIDVPSCCEGGICGACEVRWLAGEPIHRDRVLSPSRRGTHLLACVAQCASDELVIDA
jgi:ferredoxin-NADP reductase